MTTRTDLLAVARAEALFVSDLPARPVPVGAEVAAAIRNAVRRHGGTKGCAGEVAAAFGDHPDIAVPRMRWALRTVRITYQRQPRPRAGGGPAALRVPSGRTRPPAPTSTGSAAPAE
ncbi:hypothetical protein Ani05nite_27860 [Amorphoplanes nipponensis]|uniref:Uncharacterized protein n=1 Tax=Actinoplanes nipponensis TaxID=135950 RepID=A0A919MLW7_9ACTN|nr:hypothetical protein [Actinoplanes nipponensis]GIE49252.1 hypothetical protein Ani05nite_27860 [Actinoplanes nipponensis]